MGWARSRCGTRIWSAAPTPAGHSRYDRGDWHFRRAHLARYDVTKFIDALVRCAAEDDEAIFLLVPARDVGSIPRINGRMPIRGVLESDALWIPSVWIHHLESPAA